MWTIKETDTLRQSLKMKLSQYDWYVGSCVIPDMEGYAIQIEVSKMNKDIWDLIPVKTKRTNIKVVVKNNES